MQIQATAPGFDDPLGLLAACHTRIERQCETLERLPAHIAAHGVDAAAREAAAAVLRYFTQAAPHHHADEEQDLFPRLRAHRGEPGCPAELDDWLARLAREHEGLGAAWGELAPRLERIAAGNAPAELAAKVLVERYRAHYRFEDAQLLPLARRLLTARELAEIGAAMRRRRGVAG